MIFIDIGGHRGQALEVALNPKYGFSQYLILEPSSAASKYLKKFRDDKIELYPFGLGSKQSQTYLYNSGTPGASIFIKKFKNVTSKELVDIRKASDFLRPYLQNSKVFIRINCEGSEIEIIEDLLNAQLLKSSHSFLVDFDILKITPTYGLDNFLDKLAKLDLKISRRPFGSGSTREQVIKWLDAELQNDILPVDVFSFFKYKLKLYLPFRQRFVKYFSFIPIKMRIRICNLLKRH
jgi:hypothetical protein